MAKNGVIPILPDASTPAGALAGSIIGKIFGSGVKGSLTTKDFPEVSSKISQKQLRHIDGRKEYRGGGYLNNMTDAQRVLDAYRSGQAVVVGQTKQGFPIIRFEGVVGVNVNLGAKIPSQPTSVFIIKGTASPSVVPTNPKIGGGE